MINILVIDDDVDIRELLNRILTDEGYKVHIASDGIEGITIYEQNNIDLVIMDIIMPKKDGIEALLELKRQHEDVKIIAISGGGRVGPNSYLKAAHSLGADDVLSKPFRKPDLLSKINNIMKPDPD